MRLIEALNKGLIDLKKDNSKENAMVGKMKVIVKDITVGEGDDIQHWRVTIPIDDGKNKNVKN